MNDIKVLVTGIGGPIAQGIIHGLKKRQDVTIVGSDRRAVTAGHHLCDSTYQVPRYTDAENYLNAIHEISHKENIDIIFPSLHEEVMIFHEHRDELNPSVALPVSDNFKNLMHKEEAYEKLLSLGFEKYIPRYKGFNSAQALTDIKGAIFKDDSHCVIKNVSSYASLGFAILTDKSNYIEAIKTGRKNVLNFDDYCSAIDEEYRKISMEYLNGMEYSVDVYLNDGKAVVAVPRERTGVSNNIVLDGKVVNNETLIHAAEE